MTQPIDRKFRELLMVYTLAIPNNDQTALLTIVEKMEEHIQNKIDIAVMKAVTPFIKIDQRGNN